MCRQSNRSATVFSAEQRHYRLCCPPLSIRQYTSVGRRAAKKRCLPKIFDLKREDFFVLEVEEHSNTVVLQVMRQTKRGNIPFQEPLYSDCFVYHQSIPQNRKKATPETVSADFRAALVQPFQYSGGNLGKNFVHPEKFRWKMSPVYGKIEVKEQLNRLEGV